MAAILPPSGGSVTALTIILVTALVGALVGGGGERPDRSSFLKRPGKSPGFGAASQIVLPLQGMTALHNRVSQKEMKQRLYQETEPRTTLSFYRYFPVPDPKNFRDELYAALDTPEGFQPGSISLAEGT